MKDDLKDSLVQPIIVDPSNTREKIIKDAAMASVLAYIEARDSGKILEDTSWDQWLNGSYRKTVRKMPTMKAMKDLVEDYGYSSYGCAVAGGPVAYSAMPKQAKRSQVSGWDSRQDDSTSEEERGSVPFVTIYLNSALSMSVGKSAAQAAHALMRLEIIAPTSLTGCNVRVLEKDLSRDVRGEINEGENVRVVIVDNGLTEVEKGSLTAVIF